MSSRSHPIETSRYIEGLRAELADVADPVERLTIYIRYQLDAGQQFHMGLGPQLYGALSQETMRAIREHVMAIEDVLREILNDGAKSGKFIIEDEAATMSLIHACLAPREMPRPRPNGSSQSARGNSVGETPDAALC